MLTSSSLKMIHSHAVWIHRVNDILIHQPKTNSSHVLESAFPYITFTTFHTSESRGLVEKKDSERMRKRGCNRNPVHRIWFSVDKQVNPRCSNNSCHILRLRYMIIQSKCKPDPRQFISQRNILPPRERNTFWTKAHFEQLSQICPCFFVGWHFDFIKWDPTNEQQKSTNCQTSNITCSKATLPKNYHPVHLWKPAG